MQFQQRCTLAHPILVRRFSYFHMKAPVGISSGGAAGSLKYRHHSIHDGLLRNCFSIYTVFNLPYRVLFHLCCTPAQTHDTQTCGCNLDIQSFHHQRIAASQRSERDRALLSLRLPDPRCYARSGKHNWGRSASIGSCGSFVCSLFDAAATTEDGEMSLETATCHLVSDGIRGASVTELGVESAHRKLRASEGGMPLNEPNLHTMRRRIGYGNCAWPV
jgi:hypothetical protein